MAQYKVINNESAAELKHHPSNHFEACVTDSPYGIAFLNKDWDNNTGAVEVWQQVYRTLKPGAYLLAFSAPRTYHRLASNLEEIGFEIKDQIMWLYASGFPKAQDVGKLIQKQQGVEEYRDIPPHEQTRTATFDNYGAGGFGKYDEQPQSIVATSKEAKKWSGWKTALKPAHEPIVLARKPTKLSTGNNVQEWHTGALNIEGCRIPYEEELQLYSITEEDWGATSTGRYPTNILGEIKNYQKHFFCPKVHRNERNIGFCRQGNLDEGDKNNHPTVKPKALMAYLVRLVTPKNGTVLDPFCGSGSTGLGCIDEDTNFIGIELDENYAKIAQTRLDKYMEIANQTTFKDLFE